MVDEILFERAKEFGIKDSIEIEAYYFEEKRDGAIIKYWITEEGNLIYKKVELIQKSIFK